MLRDLTIKKGAYLIARASLYDSIFNRGVILITEHSEEGSLGFILNKPLNKTVRDLIPTIKCDLQVYSGGPVETKSLYYIHSRPDVIKNSIKICEEIYWSGDFEDLVFGIEQNIIADNEIRFFLGYSGWQHGQLKSEIDSNSWNTMNNIAVDIFESLDTSLWKEKIKELGGKNLMWLNMPENIIDN